MNTMIKGALIFGGLAAVSVLASRCHADINDTLACPKTAYLDEPFNIWVNTKRVFEMYRVETSSGGEYYMGLQAPRNGKDTLTTTLKIETRYWGWSDQYITIIPTIRDITAQYGYRVVPMPGGSSRVIMLPRPVPLLRRVASPKPLLKLRERSILGRLHAVVR